MKADELDGLEEALRARERALPEAALQDYRSANRKTIKDPDTYAVLVYGLGFGLHHIYIGHVIWFLLDAVASAIFWGNVIMAMTTDAAPTLALMFIAMLYNVVDFVYCLFSSQAIVRRRNFHASEKLLALYERR